MAAPLRAVNFLEDSGFEFDRHQEADRYDYRRESVTACVKNCVSWVNHLCEVGPQKRGKLKIKNMSIN